MVTSIFRRIDRRILIGLAVVLVAGVLVNVFRSPAETKAVTAHFPRAVSVFVGTDVRILGVNVGEVTAVIPEGNSVRVEMEYDAAYKVPADAKAVIVTPTLVADRFVQLTPVFTGGEAMADGADIKLEETGVPVELDRIYQSLQDVTEALGPNGVNANGTLNNLLAAAEASFDGQGAAGNQMIKDLATAADTFGNGAGPLFDSVSQLAKFTTTLAENDELVRAFMEDLTGVSAMLADESQELEDAVAAVAQAVGSVKGFVSTHRDAFLTDIQKLTRVMRTIASESKNIETAIRIAPVAMSNLQMGFDHVSDSQNSRIGIGGYVWDADGFICAVIQQHPVMPKALKDTACAVVEKLIEPIVSNLPWLPPEYKSYLPKQASTTNPNGIELPQTSEVFFASGNAGSVESLLGGAE